MTSRFTLVWTLKSKSSIVLTAGKRAALTRASPPWLSRALTSSASTAARYVSWSQPSSRAVSASRARDLAHPWRLQGPRQIGQLRGRARGHAGTSKRRS